MARCYFSPWYVFRWPATSSMFWPHPTSLVLSRLLFLCARLVSWCLLFSLLQVFSCESETLFLQGSSWYFWALLGSYGLSLACFLRLQTLSLLKSIALHPRPMLCHSTRPSRVSTQNSIKPCIVSSWTSRWSTPCSSSPPFSPFWSWRLEDTEWAMSICGMGLLPPARGSTTTKRASLFCRCAGIIGLIEVGKPPPLISIPLVYLIGLDIWGIRLAARRTLDQRSHLANLTMARWSILTNLEEWSRGFFGHFPCTNSLFIVYGRDTFRFISFHSCWWRKA